jgi:hypothetical protein
MPVRGRRQRFHIFHDAQEYEAKATTAAPQLAKVCWLRCKFKFGRRTLTSQIFLNNFLSVIR